MNSDKPSKSDDVAADETVVLDATDGADAVADSDEAAAEVTGVAESAAEATVAAPAKAVPGPTGRTRTEASRHWGVSLLLTVAVTALAVAVVSVGYFGYTGIRAYAVGGPTVELRNESVDVAEQAILNILEIDLGDPEGYQRRVRSLLVGEAAAQMGQDSVDELKKLAQQSGAQATAFNARITRSAPIEVDVDEGRAVVLVYADVRAADAAEDEPATSMGFVVSVVTIDGERKVPNIVPISPIVYQEEGN